MMEPPLYWVYAFNIVVNSAFSFFTSLLLIECCICLFRVVYPRVKAFCRLLPFIKICLDLGLYHVSKWALIHGVNPTLAEKGTRQLALLLMNPFTGIQFRMEDGKTFTIADVIALSIDPIWIWGTVFIAGVGSVTACLLYLRRIILEKRQIATIIAGATQILIKNSNASLIAWMKKKQIMLATSNAISSPCIVGKTVLIPTQLLRDLSEEEMEAIIVHEMAHFRWKDCGVRIAYSVIAALFWWIPSKGAQKRIEEVQEQAADAAIHHFGIPGIVLAGAILKTAIQKKRAESLLAFSLVGGQSRVKKRIRLILREPHSPLFRWRVMQYALLFSALASILFGTLWIF